MILAYSEVWRPILNSKNTCSCLLKPSFDLRLFSADQ